MEKNLEEIQRNAQKSYCHTLDTINVENDFDLISYCLCAGRLYSLGVEQYISKADDLLYNSSFKNNVNQIFLNRIDQGIEDVQEKTGRRVGIALTELQDMHSFLKHTSYPFSDQVRQNFLEWIEAGRYADVNADTLDYLNEFFDVNPLDDSDVLEALSEPVTQEMYELDYLLSGIRHTECQPKEVNGSWEFSDARYNLSLEFKPPTENAISFELYEQNSDGKIPVKGVKIRQDVLPAIQNPNSPLLWSINYSYFPGLGSPERKREPLSIRLPMGGVCKIPVPISASISTEKVNTDKKMNNASSIMGINLIEHRATMAASDGDQTVYKECFVKGISLALDISINQSQDQVVVNVWQDWSYNNRSKELDGWAFYNRNNTLLGVIQNSQVKFKFSQFDGYLEIKDAAGNTHKLIDKE